jgi:hypothetical protein
MSFSAHSIFDADPPKSLALAVWSAPVSFAARQSVAQSKLCFSTMVGDGSVHGCASFFGRRSSERMLVSSSQPLAKRPRALGWQACRFDVDITMRRSLHRDDERFAGEVALEPAELVDGDHDDFVAAMDGHALWPFAANPAHQLAQSEPLHPATASDPTLRRVGGCGFSPISRLAVLQFWSC